MFKSDQLGQLADALSKAQGQMGNAKKDSANPFFKSKYADLASVVDASKAELTANGLAVVQLPTMRDGKMVLEYVLLHSSGEFIGSELEMTPVKSDPQGIGSAITYARRYTWSSLTGVATEDDDGNAASGKDSRPSRPTAERSTEEKPLTRSGPQQVKPVWADGPDHIPASGPQQAGESIQGGKPAGPVPAKVYKDTFDPAAIELAAQAEASMTPRKGELPPDAISPGNAANFYREVRNALPNSLQKQSDDLAKTWLRSQGIVDSHGEPTALAIRKDSFFDVRSEAVAWAKSHQA